MRARASRARDVWRGATFAETLLSLFALNGRAISVSVSGPEALDRTLALLVGRQRDAEQLGGDAEHWLFHLEPAGAYVPLIAAVPEAEHKSWIGGDPGTSMSMPMSMPR